MTTPTQTAVAPPTRLPSLTSLRWFAALVVFVHHTGAYVPALVDVAWYQRISQQGLVGVSFFFVLSGFVLTWSTRPGDSARAFYRRRFARIGPAYWVSCVLALPVLWFIGKLGSAGQVATAVVPFTGLQAWLPWNPIFFGGNAVGWSLSCELFFYAMFPLFAPVLAAWSTRRVKLVLAVAAVVALVTPSLVAWRGLWFFYINPPLRLMEFVVGVCLAVLVRRGARLPLPLPAALALAVGAYLAAGWAPLALRTVAITLVPFALVIVAAAQSDLEGRARMLRSPLLVRLGEWSFAFYLLHQLVLKLAQHVEQSYALRPGSQLWVTVLALVVGIAAAAALYTCVERPCERRLRTSRPTRLLPRNAPALDAAAAGRSCDARPASPTNQSERSRARSTG